MSASEAINSPEALNPGEQLTQAFLDVAIATQATQHETRLSEVYDRAIARHDITETNYPFLDNHQLVNLALEGIKARLSERRVQEAEEIERNKILDLEKLLLALRDRPITVSSLDGSSVIEHCTFRDGSYATEGYVSSVTGIVIPGTDRKGSRLTVDRKRVPFKGQKAGRYFVPVIDTQTTEQLVRIDIGD